MAAEDRIHAVVDPIVEELELELVDLVYGGGRLKITIDHPDGLGTDLLTKTTRLISHELDLADPVNGTYTLEVTSPGVERELRTVAHYERSVGESVALKLKPNDQNLRRLKGELRAVTESDVTVIQDGESHTISYDRIARAKTVFDWGPAPKPGSKKKNATKNAPNSKNTENTGKPENSAKKGSQS